MLPDGSLRAEGIWKRFRAEKTVRTARGKLRLRSERRKLGDARSKSYRWALRDLSFDIKPGDAVGLIGHNGSGKSTLLKILGRVMYPYAGKVESQGRIGALIEVRAGIHPELTGRENVQLYGSLLGLSKRDVQARFDDIIDFAEISQAVDRQVKFYSSGMQMRLGFAVAAFLEPDIMLIDEVLAVGDASFQQKCLDRMRYVLDQGTTVVFVSHDLAAVESLCSRVLWLESGVMAKDGPSRDVVGAYRRSVEELAEMDFPDERAVRLVKAEASSLDGAPVQTDGPLEVRLRLESTLRTNALVVIGISEGTASPILSASQDISLTPGEPHDLTCVFERLPLRGGRYFVWIGVFANREDLLPWRPVASFDVFGARLDRVPRAIVRLAPIATKTTWTSAT